MCSLEEKILHSSAGYCSDSSDDDIDEEVGIISNCDLDSNFNASSRSGYSTNTGPKGVIQDWKTFCQLENQRLKQLEDQAFSIANRFNVNINKSEVSNEQEISNSEDDIFLRDYFKRRMQEMMMSKQITNCSNGKVLELKSADEYLKVIEEESEKCLTLIHIYEIDLSGCDAVNRCFLLLAKMYTMVKFYYIRASVLPTSHKFRTSGLPVLQAYRNGELIGNFVRLIDDLGEDISTDDLESFLKDYGILPDLALNRLVGLNLNSTLLKNSSQVDYDNDLD